jgi:hypothetical protein
VARTSNGMKEAATALHARIADAPAVDVEAACKEFWQTWGTLPRRPVDLVALRRQALRTIRDEQRGKGVEVGFIARSLGIAPNRFSRLTSLKGEEAAA